MNGPPGAQDERRARPPLGNLELRILSALVLVAGVFAVTYAGGLAFRLFVVAMAVTIFYEWVAMARAAANRGHLALTALLLALVFLVMMAGFGAMTVMAVLGAALAACMLHAAIGGFGYRVTAGLAYAAVPAAALAFLRGADAAGFWAVLYLFAAVWATDVAAYFAGRAAGGPRLAPAISPGKTWSGAIGGAAGGILGGVMLVGYAGTVAGMAFMIAVALALSVASQAGDLFESWVKRRHGVKDSGRLIPGHGGVMDRVDGLVAATMVLYLVGGLLSGPDMPAHAFFSP